MGLFRDLVEARPAFGERVRADPQLIAFAPAARAVIGMAGDAGEGIALSIARDGIEIVDAGLAETTMRAGSASWDACLEAHPRPPFHHFLAMRMRVPGSVVQGDETLFAQHAHIARRLVELARSEVGGEAAETRPPEIDRSGISGRYITVPLEGRRVDIRVEEAGRVGLPALLVLHTAGADARQAHPIMCDPDVLAEYRVVAFDLPGHGGSSRLDDVFGAWTLTTQRYTDTILGVIETLGLDRPVLIGASMAGEACLAMARRAPRALAGVIACEAAEHVPGRSTPWPRDPRVNAMAFTPEWIDGLIAPHAPAKQREEIRWQYSQGGLGIFPGDIDFYSGDWDGRGTMASIDTGSCPVIMMTGEYDYSCTPEMSEATAQQIPGAEYWTMPGLGHFPVCENPEAFAPHLKRALQLIERKRNG